MRNCCPNQLVSIMCIMMLLSGTVFGQVLQLNGQGYFETRGVNILVFSNEYNGMFFDEKTAGIELIHHGVRTATGGAVRLQPTPEQWDLVPLVMGRRVDRDAGVVEVSLRYEAFQFDWRVRVAAKNKGVAITVFFEKPLPDSLVGRAGFNLEFLPSAYFEHTYLADGTPGIFPLAPYGDTEIRPVAQKIPQYAGHTTFDDRGKGEYIVPHPLASAKTLVLAPEDPERRVIIRSATQPLELYDGRLLAQNGWFVVRSVLPARATGAVLEWYVEPNAVPDWVRTPVIGFSQAGYHPSQAKVAIMELDRHDVPPASAAVCQVTEEGNLVERYRAETKPWGPYFRYSYATFDFSAVKDTGLFVIVYGKQRTDAFPIGSRVYKDIWHPTLDVWFPVQMDHMAVNEAYRVWHGQPYRDDALQAPVNHEHFDGYRMGPTTETRYKPLEHIPGLAVGGWFDAGDFDIQTGSHCGVLLSFVDSWETFHLTRDETTIDQEGRFVDIHRPDGKPDLLQQIEHGTLQLVAQIENIGHPVRGIIVPNLHQYHHLGDASTITDNLPYNAALKPYESDGRSSGTMDDRWVFTGREPLLDYFTAGALAASSRALREFNAPLAGEALTCARKLWDDAVAVPAGKDTSVMMAWFGASMKLGAALQLYVTTGDPGYAARFNEWVWTSLDGTLPFAIGTAVRACPIMDRQYRERLRPYVARYAAMLDTLDAQNPYGVSLMTRGWGGNSPVVMSAITNYYVHREFPELMGSDRVTRGLSYVLGCHPYSNLSFVSGIGTRSKKVTYGSNRADFRFIPGGIVPGIMVLKPDFPENKDDWPFLWGENECVIDLGAMYIFLANAADDIVTRK
jgi:endoglucanase